MKKLFILMICAAMLFAAGCEKEEPVLDSLPQSITVEKVSENAFKTVDCANPISPNIYCADPTGVEYNGRLYVFGTNDNQQFEVKGKGNGGGYEYIKSLVIFSTDDMVNWVYHGIINVEEVAPWIYNSWAPSVISRVEKDGKTHFYLYFSNGGAGVGVITATDPLGPWKDPLGEPLIYQNMPGLENCPAPFDPGAVIDENGVGWLAFGGGAPNGDGIIHTNIPKIVRLGDDLLSFDSEFVSIDAPYFFEASELNYSNGEYIYTYCNDWQNHRVGWGEYGDKADPPPGCSMSYMTSKTPLDPDSWEYRGAYFYNAGENSSGQSGMRWSNNHTHYLEYQGTNYILHHTMLLEELNGSNDGFRSLMVDYLPIDEDGSIPIQAATKEGVDQIKSLDPYAETPGSEMFTCADIGFEGDINPAAVSNADGAWIYLKGADFKEGANEFIAKVKGKGRIEIRLDDVNAEPAAYIEFDCEEFTNIRSPRLEDKISGEHGIYIVFSGSDIKLQNWKFAAAAEDQE